MIPSCLLSATKAVTIDSIIMYCPVITRQENANTELEDELIGVTWTGKVTLLKAKNGLPFFTNDHEGLCVAEEIELKFGESIEIRVNPPVTLEDGERYCIRVHQVRQVSLTRFHRYYYLLLLPGLLSSATCFSGRGFSAMGCRRKWVGLCPWECGNLQD